MNDELAKIKALLMRAQQDLGDIARLLARYNPPEYSTPKRVEKYRIEQLIFGLQNMTYHVGSGLDNL